MVVLRPIVYSRGSLRLLDQRLLPREEEYIDIPSCEAAHDAIKGMAVRGAPAIGVAGVLALLVELHNGGAGSQFASASDAAERIKERLDYLVTSRPTAVNLLDASRKLKTRIDEVASRNDASPEQVVDCVIQDGEDMLEADVAANKAMGAIGMDAMLQAAAERGLGINGRVRVLTHCNTGSLATVQYGTALGCIRSLWEAGKLEHAFCTETRPAGILSSSENLVGGLERHPHDPCAFRPYNQGARLTAYELKVEGIPSTLIADSAAAALMAKGLVDAVVVGADRVAANGDAANKVGTCMLSVAAAAFGVPFFIAAPTTSIDPYLATGRDIEIEERSASELTHSSSHKDCRVVVDGMHVWNPAFDVAEAKDITGIITEKGMVPKASDSSEAGFAVRAFFRAHGLPVPDAADAGAPASGHEAPAALQQLSAESAKAYVAAHARLAERVGARAGAHSLNARELSDGNINFVYVVEGPTGGVILKQSLPYVRVVGEDWPLAQERLAYEVKALQELHSHCPAHVPVAYNFDSASCVLAMQYLAPPHAVLRFALLDGHCFPRLAEQASEYLAACLFRTSQLKLGSRAFRSLCERFSNPEMCALSEQVIFTDPYYKAPYNRNHPALDDVAKALYDDADAKLAAARAKQKFLECKEALVHGDLHTGSCMVTADTFYVIDSEFACVGPMGVDIGFLIANLIVTFYAMDGYSTDEAPRAEQRSYIIQTIRDIWNKFSVKFTDLWYAESEGSATYAHEIFASDAVSTTAAQTRFLERLFQDVLLFAGCELIRRLVGIATLPDFPGIEDAGARGVCEMRAFKMGRELLVNPAQFSSIEAVADEVVAIRDDGQLPRFEMKPALS